MQVNQGILVQGGGAGGVTTFSEDFSTTPVNGLPRWISGTGGAAGGPLFAYNGAFRITGGGVGGNPSFAIPTFNGQQGLPATMTSQYAKSTYQNTTAGLFRGGLGVMLAGRATSGVLTDMQGYYIQMVVDGATANLQSIVGAGFVGILGIFVPANGDVLEIEAAIGVAANTVRVWQNGVLRATFVDNAANRPGPGGVFGYYYTDGGGGAQNWGPFLGKPAR